MSKISFWKILTRKKILQGDTNEESKLGRILGTLDLAALGIGATLGVGVYVLAGHVSRDQSGPSVILSFLIAAAASFLAGLCYAEFGARVPKSGSAYVYSYVCIGELIAFVIGWNLLLEYIIGSASISKGLSLYVDSLTNDTLKKAFGNIAPLHWDFLADYFDFFAFCIPLILGVALAFGLKKSAMVNNCFTLVNILIVMFVIIAGSFKADIANWRINPNDPELPPEANIGNGGFFPFGFSGTLKGAATCFFGYVGFDCIATTGEEVQNPKKSIPMAILISLFTIFMAYFGISTVLTLMYPYYLQDVNAPLPHVFSEIGWTVAKWIVAVGGIFGLIASLFGASYPIPRVIYAIAQDGLIFRQLGAINEKFKTPVIGTLCAALLTGTFSALFDLKALVNMLSIGTLLAYTVVAISILILRCSNNLDETSPPSYNDLNQNFAVSETSRLNGSEEKLTFIAFWKQFFNIQRLQRPTSTSMTVAGILVALYCISALGLALTVYYAATDILAFEVYAVMLTSFFTFLAIILIIALAVQPRERPPEAFTVPFVPFLPCSSIFINMLLMLMLDYYTWIRFAVWMLIGGPIYILCICCFRNKSFVAKKDIDTIEIMEIDYKTIMTETTDQLQKSENENIMDVQENFRHQVENQVDLILDLAVITAENRSNCNNNSQSFEQQILQQINCILDLAVESVSKIISGNESNLKIETISVSKVYSKEPEVDFTETIKESEESHRAIAFLDEVLENIITSSRKNSNSSINSSSNDFVLSATAVVHFCENNFEELSSTSSSFGEQNNHQGTKEKPVLSFLNETDKTKLVSTLNNMFQEKTSVISKPQVSFVEEKIRVSNYLLNPSLDQKPKSEEIFKTTLRPSSPKPEHKVSPMLRKKKEELSNLILKSPHGLENEETRNIKESDSVQTINIRTQLELILQQRIAEKTETISTASSRPNPLPPRNVENKNEIKYVEQNNTTNKSEKQQVLYSSLIAELNPPSRPSILKKTSFENNQKNHSNDAAFQPTKPEVVNSRVSFNII